VISVPLSSPSFFRAGSAALAKTPLPSIRLGFTSTAGIAAV
jgi:hypothetical protein